MAELPHILAAIESTPWAMTSDAVRVLRRAASRGLSATDYSLFHGADKAKTEAVSAVLGERASDDSRFSFVRDGVGALQINGPIIPRADAFSDVSGMTSIDRLSREFVGLSARVDVDTILLVIDSPGGAITGIAEFASMVRASAKPVVAYAYGHAASAAYWIASAAQKLYVGETSMVGSIGVVMTVFNGDGDDNEVELVSSQSPDKRPDVGSDAGRATLQAYVDQLGATFVKRVATNRGVDEKTVLEKFGRGGMVMPENAVAVGMADAQMTLGDFFSKKISNQIDFSSTSRDEEKEGDGIPVEEKMAEKTMASMTLEEILKESPVAKAEFDKQIAAAKAEGETTGKGAADKDFAMRSEKATKILASDVYPQQLKDVASQVLAGKATVERLADMQTMFDALSARNDIKIAQGETASAPKTPGQQVPALSTDGVIRSAADLDAAASAMRAGR